MPELSGTKQRSFSLTPQEIKFFQSNPLTFRSLAGGKFRCNQIERFGKISRASVKLIQGQLTKHGGGNSKVNVVKRIP